MVVCARALQLAFALTLVPAAGDAPTLAPEPGTRVLRSAQQSFTLSLEGWDVVWNGAQVPSGFLPELEIEVTEEARVEVEDEYLECAAGRPLRLRRRVLAAAGTALEASDIDGEPAGPVGEREGTSELEGCVVLFAEGGAERTLEEGDCSDEALERLVVDMDLTGLLDPEGVARDEDGWEVELEAQSPLDLAGAFSILFEDVEGSERHGDPDQLARNAQGTWLVRPDGQREEDGRELEVFALEARVETFAESAADLAEVPIVDGSATELTSMRFEYEGEALWDPAESRLHAAELRADVSMTVKVTRDLEGVEGEPTYHHVLRFAGEAALRIETSPAP